MTSRGPIDIRLAGIDKRFPGVHALRRVDLRLRGGEVHGLVGQNGAGKSSLIKILTGAIQPDAGEVLVDGETMRFHSPADAETTGLAVVYQDSQFFPELSVADNILIAHPSVRRIGPFTVRDRGDSYQRARDLLDRLQIDLDVRAPAGTLGPAERKFMEIARAVAAHARALLLDEPTAALQPREVMSLFGLLERLRTEQVGILFVSHKLDEVMRISTRVTILSDGAVIAHQDTNALDLDVLVALVAGGEIKEAEKTFVSGGSHLLGARGVSASGVGPIDLDVHSGEVISLTGVLGCGATRFARWMAGADYFGSGEVVMEGRRLRPGDRAHAAKAGVGFVPEDRKIEGIVPKLSIEQNIALASLRSVAPPWWLSRRRMRELAERFLSLLDIRPPDPTMPAGNLSGGNQQKVLLARWLASRARVLVTEEPTHGIDVRAKPEIMTILRKFAVEGGCVVLVSRELADVLTISNRIAVFREGRLVDILPQGATEQQITARSMGLNGAA